MVRRYPERVFKNKRQHERGDLVSPDEGFEVREAAFEYRPRRPEESVLYGVVAGHLETFLARQHERGRVVPRFVERELRAFLDCGVLVRGFLRVRCDACRLDRVVPFSCKCRGFCPSCGGRHMADTAAHLVDRVFPEVPVRQWVLSVPFALRYRLAYDSSLVKEVLQIFVRTVFASIRRRAGIPALNRQARCGAVAFIQRFSDALNLDPHFHALALDGIYVAGEHGEPVFRRVPPPSNVEIARVAHRVHRRVGRLMERRGLGPQADPDEADSLRRDEPLLAELYSASILGRAATRPRAGRRIARVGDDAHSEYPSQPSARCCAAVAGFSVHAGVCVPPRDRLRLERLCRYAGRPPLATGRLSLLPDGRLLYRLKHRWRDGTTHVIYEPMELMARLAALVPAPRFNITRYFGVLAPAATFRRLIVPQVEPHPSTHPCCQVKMESEITECGTSKKKRRPKSGYYPWAQLMTRVFSIDVLACPRCGARLRILCAINPPDAIRKILACLGLSARNPPISPAT